MGYNTDFNGEFNLNKPLTEAQKNYLEKFAGTRRVKRNASIAEKMNDPERVAVGLPVGTDGEFFVGGLGFAGQDDDDSVVSSNNPPSAQPGLWCQWIPNDTGTAIIWDGGEKFYNYVEWLDYLIENIFKPWGYVLNGEMYWYGEDRDDAGIIFVENNEIRVKSGTMVYS